MIPTPLDAATIQQNLTTRTFGQHLILTPQIGSTNDALKQLADAGAAEGTLYLTEEQTAGRGRLQRRWHAPPHSSLLMSLLFRPHEFVQPAQTQRLTMLCALALVEAIETVAPVTLHLKWPNDLVTSTGQKLGGILTEYGLTPAADGLAWVIVGMGINVNLTRDQLPAEAQQATSIAQFAGQPVDRLAILTNFLPRVEQRYHDLQQGRLPHEAWASRLIGRDQTVTVTHLNGEQQTGQISGVNADGALLLRQADGSLTPVWAGDVTLRQPQTR